MSLAGACLLARRCPAFRRREPGLLLLRGTGEGVPGYALACFRPGDRERPGRPKREGLSTVAGLAGGPARSSGDARVMRAERRGRVVRGSVRSVNRGDLGGIAWAS
jgi:hypothetical protein